MLTQSRANGSLAPFGLQLSSAQMSQLLTYLEVLLRWNRRINLTAIRTPEECLTRHFGESLYLARWVELHGRLLDIGSGAGFPGLALRIPFPQLQVTLLEPVAKKRAFLKEVARACAMERVDVRGERLEEFIRKGPGLAFDAVTARAVGRLAKLIPQAASCLKIGGQLCLWVSRDQASELSKATHPVWWRGPIPLPLARQREIWIGTRVTPNS